MIDIIMEVVPATGTAICCACWKVILHKPIGVEQVNITLGTKHWSYHPKCFKSEHKEFINRLVATND